MKGKILLGLATLSMVIAFTVTGVSAQMGQVGPGMGMMGMQGQTGPCPWYGQGQMGTGMGMGQMGHGMMMGPGMGGPQGWYECGPGMMMGGSQGWCGPGMMWQYQQPQKALEEKDTKVILENYLQSTRNPNLKLGKIKDIGSAYEAEIVTKENSLVNKITVDKNTGWMRSAY